MQSKQYFQDRQNGSVLSHSPMTVAAVDESFSNRDNLKLAYVVVACSLPDSSSRDQLPTNAKVKALREPGDYGLVITGLVLPPWTSNKERFSTWRDGVLYGLNYADEQLREHGSQGIGIALVDGQKPNGFWRGANLDGRIKDIDVRFAPKIGHHYGEYTDPFAAQLLTLADRAVVQFRRRMDERGDLEAIIGQLRGEQQLYQPYVFHPLKLPGQNGNRNGNNRRNGRNGGTGVV